MKVSFLGDISLNDAYNSLFQKGQRPFDGIKDILSTSDLVVGNLECMAEGCMGENALKRPRLKTRIETLGYVRDIHLSLATLAHNHTYDNLLDGFQKTVSFLKKNNIASIGAGKTAQDAGRPCNIKQQGVSVCFLNYVSADTNPCIPDGADLAVNFFSRKKALEDIRRLKPQADHLVLLLHWGGRFEGGYYPDYVQPRIAHELIDAGADLIIGGHSHTLQPWEVYRGKHIFYSLGNFCFADIHFENQVYIMNTAKLSESLIVEVDFSKHRYTVNLLPITRRNLHVIIDRSILAGYERRLRTFRRFYRYQMFWIWYWLRFKVISRAVRCILNPGRVLRNRLKLRCAPKTAPGEKSI